MDAASLTVRRYSHAVVQPMQEGDSPWSLGGLGTARGDVLDIREC